MQSQPSGPAHDRTLQSRMCTHAWRLRSLQPYVQLAHTRSRVTSLPGSAQCALGAGPWRPPEDGSVACARSLSAPALPAGAPPRRRATQQAGAPSRAQAAPSAGRCPRAPRAARPRSCARSAAAPAPRPGTHPAARPAGGHAAGGVWPAPTASLRSRTSPAPRPAYGACAARRTGHALAEALLLAGRSRDSLHCCTRPQAVSGSRAARSPQGRPLPVSWCACKACTRAASRAARRPCAPARRAARLAPRRRPQRTAAAGLLVPRPPARAQHLRTFALRAPSSTAFGAAVRPATAATRTAEHVASRGAPRVRLGAPAPPASPTAARQTRSSRRQGSARRAP
jgi:hypothetical protein